jgi:LemA protein
MRVYVKRILIAAVVLLALGLGARLRFLSSRASLAAQRTVVTDSWSAVDAALREHSELLPALAEKIQLAPKLEAQTRQTITEGCGVLAQARPPREKIQAYHRLSREIGRLLLAADLDPQLRADPAFLLIKEEFTAADNRVLVARRKYNEALERYNASLAVFPHNVVALLSGYSRDDAYFPTAPDARAPSKE